MLQAEQLRRAVEELSSCRSHFSERLPCRWLHCDQSLEQLIMSGLIFCSLAQVRCSLFVFSRSIFLAGMINVEFIKSLLFTVGPLAKRCRAQYCCYTSIRLFACHFERSLVFLPTPTKARLLCFGNVYLFILHLTLFFRRYSLQVKFCRHFQMMRQHVNT